MAILVIGVVETIKMAEVEVEEGVAVEDMVTAVMKVEIIITKMVTSSVIILVITVMEEVISVVAVVVVVALPEGTWTVEVPEEEQGVVVATIPGEAVAAVLYVAVATNNSP